MMRWKVNEAESGQRVDVIVRSHLPHLGRAGVKRLLLNHAVTVDGHRPKKNWLLRTGQELEAIEEFLDSASSTDESLLENEIVIVQEHADYLIINKPPGLASVSLNGSNKPSAAKWLNRHYPTMKTIGYGPLESGLIHRLDTYTSGSLIAAKNADAFHILQQALRTHQLTKTYLALTTEPLPFPRGKIRTALEARGKGRVHVATARDASSFESSYSTLGSLTAHRSKAPLYLIEVKATAAYRHQVRAHLADLGAPLLGDELYGGQSYHLSPRHALACVSIKGTLSLPGSQHLHVETELSPDLCALGEFGSLLQS